MHRKFVVVAAAAALANIHARDDADRVRITDRCDDVAISAETQAPAVLCWPETIR